MVDRIKKSIRKLSRRDRDAAESIIEIVKRGEIKHLRIKKLRGHDNIFRVRKGRLRIIYLIHARGRVEILDVNLRSDTTYKKYK